MNTPTKSEGKENWMAKNSANKKSITFSNGFLKAGKGDRKSLINKKSPLSLLAGGLKKKKEAKKEDQQQQPYKRTESFLENQSLLKQKTGNFLSNLNLDKIQNFNKTSQLKMSQKLEKNGQKSEDQDQSEVLQMKQINEDLMNRHYYMQAFDFTSNQNALYQTNDKTNCFENFIENYQQKIVQGGLMGNRKSEDQEEGVMVLQNSIVKFNEIYLNKIQQRSQTNDILQTVKKEIYLSCFSQNFAYFYFGRGKIFVFKKFNLQKQDQIISLELEEDIVSIDVNLYDQFLILGQQDGGIVIYNIKKQKIERKIIHVYEEILLQPNEGYYHNKNILQRRDNTYQFMYGENYTIQKVYFLSKYRDFSVEERFQQAVICSIYENGDIFLTYIQYKFFKYYVKHYKIHENLKGLKKVAILGPDQVSGASNNKIGLANDNLIFAVAGDFSTQIYTLQLSEKVEEDLKINILYEFKDFNRFEHKFIFNYVDVCWTLFNTTTDNTKNDQQQQDDDVKLGLLVIFDNRFYIIKIQEFQRFWDNVLEFNYGDGTYQIDKEDQRQIIKVSTAILHKEKMAFASFLTQDMLIIIDFENFLYMINTAQIYGSLFQKASNPKNMIALESLQNSKFVLKCSPVFHSSKKLPKGILSEANIEKFRREEKPYKKKIRERMRKVIENQSSLKKIYYRRYHHQTIYFDNYQQTIYYMGKYQMNYLGLVNKETIIQEMDKRGDLVQKMHYLLSQQKNYDKSINQALHNKEISQNKGSLDSVYSYIIQVAYELYNLAKNTNKRDSCKVILRNLIEFLCMTSFQNFLFSDIFQKIIWDSEHNEKEKQKQKQKQNENENPEESSNAIDLMEIFMEELEPLIIKKQFSYIPNESLQKILEILSNRKNFTLIQILVTSLKLDQIDSQPIIELTLQYSLIEAFLYACTQGKTGDFKLPIVKFMEMIRKSHRNKEYGKMNEQTSKLMEFLQLSLTQRMITGEYIQQQKYQELIIDFLNFFLDLQNFELLCKIDLEGVFQVIHLFFQGECQEVIRRSRNLQFLEQKEVQLHCIEFFVIKNKNTNIERMMQFILCLFMKLVPGDESFKMQNILKIAEKKDEQNNFRFSRVSRQFDNKEGFNIESFIVGNSSIDMAKLEMCITQFLLFLMLNEYLQVRVDFVFLMIRKIFNAPQILAQISGNNKFYANLYGDIDLIENRKGMKYEGDYIDEYKKNVFKSNLIIQVLLKYWDNFNEEQIQQLRFNSDLSRFYEATVFLYSQDKQYNKCFNLLVNNQNIFTKKRIFSWLNCILNNIQEIQNPQKREDLRGKIKEIIIESILQLMQISTEQTIVIFSRYMRNDSAPLYIIKQLSDYPEIQLKLLDNYLLGITDAEENSSIEKSMLKQHINLISKYAPERLVAELRKRCYPLKDIINSIRTEIYNVKKECGEYFLDCNIESNSFIIVNNAQGVKRNEKFYENQSKIISLKKAESRAFQMDNQPNLAIEILVSIIVFKLSAQLMNFSNSVKKRLNFIMKASVNFLLTGQTGASSGSINMNQGQEDGEVPYSKNQQEYRWFIDEIFEYMIDICRKQHSEEQKEVVWFFLLDKAVELPELLMDVVEEQKRLTSSNNNSGNLQVSQDLGKSQNFFTKMANKQGSSFNKDEIRTVVYELFNPAINYSIQELSQSLGADILVDKIRDKYGEMLTFGAIAESFSNMKKDVQYQNQIEEIFLEILKNDVILKEIEVNVIYKKSNVNTPVCEVCNQEIILAKNRLFREEMVLFECRHIYHKRCVYKTQENPDDEGSMNMICTQCMRVEGNLLGLVVQSTVGGGSGIEIDTKSLQSSMGQHCYDIRKDVYTKLKEEKEKEIMENLQNEDNSEQQQIDGKKYDGIKHRLRNWNSQRVDMYQQDYEFQLEKEWDMYQLSNDL